MPTQANSVPIEVSGTLAAALDLGEENGTSEEERILVVKTLVGSHLCSIQLRQLLPIS